MKRSARCAVVILTAALLLNPSAEVQPAGLSVADYATLQMAIDANPGRLLFVPAGDYEITEKIRIRGERSGLCGPGRIIQLNADQPIIEIENAIGAEIRDLTLTMPEGKMETANEAVLAIQCRDLVIDNLASSRKSTGPFTSPPKPSSSMSQ